MNELMLELRLHGRSRNALHEALSELGWADVPGLSADQRKKLVFDRQVIREQIASLDQKVEPLILEWFNRYRMYEESARLLGEWRDFQDVHSEQRLGGFKIQVQQPQLGCVAWEKYTNI